MLHGRWAYKIARLTDGATVVVDYHLAPRTVKTLLSGSTAGDETATQLTDDGTVRFDHYSTDVARIAKAMMFHEAIGGTQYTSEWKPLSAFRRHEPQDPIRPGRPAGPQPERRKHVAKRRPIAP